MSTTRGVCGRIEAFPFGLLEGALCVHCKVRLAFKKGAHRRHRLLLPVAGAPCLSLWVWGGGATVGCLTPCGARYWLAALRGWFQYVVHKDISSDPATIHL